MTVKFFGLTFLVSWLLWFSAAKLLGGTLTSRSALAPAAQMLVLIGVFAPALVALALTAREDGRLGTNALLRRVVAFPSQARWYVFALGFFALVKLVVASLQHVATGMWPALGQIPFYLLLAAIAISTPVQAGEEIGWRGYALPRLTQRLGLPFASIVLGVLWACWHLPFFFIPGSDNAGQSFPVYLLAVTALSVVMAWLYWRTNGSLFIVMLMHAAVDNEALVVPSPSHLVNPFSLQATLAAWLTATVLWLFAIFPLVQMSRTVKPLAIR